MSYDPRIATGVGSMPVDIGTSVGPDTVRPAVRQSRDAVQFGLWWGESCKVPESDTWSNGTRHDFDSTNASDRATMLRETDLAIQKWNARVIGLDAYTIANTNPGRAVEWLKFLRQRYPRVLFITEAAPPDFLHVIAPTCTTEADPGDSESAFWLCQYINPGHEYIVPFNGASTHSANALRLAASGFTPIAGWTAALDEATRSARRWTELGERAVPGFDSARPGRDFTVYP